MIKMPPDFRFMVWYMLLLQEAGLIKRAVDYANAIVMLLEENKP